MNVSHLYPETAQVFLNVLNLRLASDSLSISELTSKALSNIMSNLCKRLAILRRRVEAGVAKLPSYIPGGMANIRHSWPTESRMQLEVVTFGQVIPATVDLMLERVRVTLWLPAMLSLMAGPIEAVVRKSGE